MTSNEATKALAFLFETISREGNLKKLIVNGTESKLCIPPNALARVSSTPEFILQLHDCNPTHHQLQALSNSRCPLIFDKSPIDDIEDRLFSGQIGLKVAFTQSCPKFRVLSEFVTAGKLKCLIFHKIDLLDVYQRGTDDARVASTLAVEELNALPYGEVFALHLRGSPIYPWTRSPNSGAPNVSPFPSPLSFLKGKRDEPFIWIHVVPNFALPIMVQRTRLLRFLLQLYSIPTKRQL